MEVVFVRLPGELKSKIKAQAKELGLSLSTYMRVLIIRALKDKENGGGEIDG